MKILLAYASLSGGTKKLAEQIDGYLNENNNHDITNVHVTKKDYSIQTLFSSPYDLYIFGTWTANKGRGAPRMRRFIKEMVLFLNDKPNNVAVFGTGDTQWGTDVYCGGAKRMHDFFNSQHPLLLIEQFPTSQDQQAIKNWVNSITV